MAMEATRRATRLINEVVERTRQSDQAKEAGDSRSEESSPAMPRRVTRAPDQGLESRLRPVEKTQAAFARAQDSLAVPTVTPAVIRGEMQVEKRASAMEKARAAALRVEEGREGTDGAPMGLTPPSPSIGPGGVQPRRVVRKDDGR
jgi:hypothetical protein